MAELPIQSDSYWLACNAGAHICVLPVGDVIEIMRPLPIEAFGHAPSFVAGLALIRAVPTVVVDMRKLIGEPPRQAARFVTVKIARQSIALAFDSVTGLYKLSRLAASQLPPLLQGADRNVVTYVTAKDKDLLLFFESSRIVPPDVVESLNEKRSSL